MLAQWGDLIGRSSTLSRQATQSGYWYIKSRSAVGFPHPDMLDPCLKDLAVPEEIDYANKSLGDGIAKRIGAPPLLSRMELAGLRSDRPHLPMPPTGTITYICFFGASLNSQSMRRVKMTGPAHMQRPAAMTRPCSLWLMGTTCSKHDRLFRARSFQKC